MGLTGLKREVVTQQGNTILPQVPGNDGYMSFDAQTGKKNFTGRGGFQTCDPELA